MSSIPFVVPIPSAVTVGPGTLITTLSLVNTSGSTQPANFITPFFGHVFKKGDIPAGQFPQFQLTGGTACPMSYGGLRTWSDGSWKFARFFLRVPTSIAGNGTLTVNILNGGSAPATSARSLTDLNNAQIQVNATAASIPSGGANISGTWVASLATAISDNQEICVVADGAAGKMWRIMGDLKQSGAAHGQLICHHYAAALTDSSNALGGFRYLPRIFQPYYNQDSPAKNWRAFSAVNFQYGAGPTTVNFPYPYNSPQFTWPGSGVNTLTPTGGSGYTNGTNYALTASGGGGSGFAGLVDVVGGALTNARITNAGNSYTTVPTILFSAGSGTGGSIAATIGSATFVTASPANNFYTGAGDNDGGVTNMIPGYLTTTGTLPSGLSLNRMYWAYANKNNANIAICTVSANGGGAVTATDNGTGTHTFNPVFSTLHFGSIFGATNKAKYNFFQGAGSFAAESTVQVQFSNTYWHTTKCLPPYDLTVAANDNATWLYNWDPCTIGPFDMNTGNTGERSDIGPIPSWAVRHFYNQSTNSELLIRIMGFAAAHFGNSCRDQVTGGPVNITSGSYTGIPASLASTFRWDTNTADVGGFTAPPTGNSSFQFAGGDTSHVPSCAYYPYLVTGEPQFCDLMVEMALGAVFNLISDALHRNPTLPNPGATGVVMFPSTQRAVAWGLRDIFHAEGLYPDTSPDGKGIGSMLTTMRSTNTSWFVTTLQSTTNSYFETNGIWLPTSLDVPACRQSSPWQQSYGGHALCAAAGLCEDANALTAINTLATYYNHLLTTFGGFLMTGYYNHVANSSSPAPSNLITDDAHFGSTGFADSFSWVPGTTAAFTITGANNHAWAPSTDDMTMFINDLGLSSTLPGGSFSFNTPYYIVSWSSTGAGSGTFGLSATKGGSAITVTDTNSTDTQSQVVVPHNNAVSPMSTGIAAGGSGPEGYCGSILGGARHMKALTGTSVFDATITDFAARFSAHGISYVTDPKWACSTSF